MFYFVLNQKDKPWGAAKKLRETVCHFIFAEMMYESS